MGESAKQCTERDSRIHSCICAAHPRELRQFLFEVPYRAKRRVVGIQKTKGPLKKMK